MPPSAQTAGSVSANSLAACVAPIPLAISLVCLLWHSSPTSNYRPTGRPTQYGWAPDAGAQPFLSKTIPTGSEGASPQEGVKHRKKQKRFPGKCQLTRYGFCNTVHGFSRQRRNLSRERGNRPRIEPSLPGQETGLKKYPRILCQVSYMAFFALPAIKDKRPQCSIRNTTVCHPPKDILEPCVGPMLDSGIPVLS